MYRDISCLLWQVVFACLHMFLTHVGNALGPKHRNRNRLPPNICRRKRKRESVCVFRTQKMAGKIRRFSLRRKKERIGNYSIGCPLIDLFPEAGRVVGVGRG
jgi:hypothetical protein